ncbi:MAG TPA: SBBP repeat-containing protein, partial [Thermoplasmata archaeon]|nr:SBBP repeat-containing protein [Thermoplasmata archaeon]
MGSIPALERPGASGGPGREADPSPGKRGTVNADARSAVFPASGWPSALWSLIIAGLVFLPTAFLVSSTQVLTSPLSISSGPAALLASAPGASPPILGGFFTENQGQVRNGDVRYYLVSGGLRVGMIQSGLLIEMIDPGPGDSGAASGPQPDSFPEGDGHAAAVSASLIRVDFEGSNRVAPVGSGELPFRSNYLSGNDPSTWHRGIASYHHVTYAGLYDGIDLVYHADATGLKYEFRVSPGADPGRIRWSYAGAVGLQIQDGALIIRTNVGEIHDAPPVAIQDRREVPCWYTSEGTSIGLACDAWDPARALTIDPLLYSTFLGGSTYSRATAIAVDASGNAFVTGYTSSVDFPTTPGAFLTTYAGGLRDAFVVKLNPSGTDLVYATFLGGSGTDRAFAIAVDSAGDATVAGYTNSTDFPVTPGASRTNYSGGEKDAFVARLDSAGSALVYATFLGGDFDDRAYAVALDSSGDAFVAGLTNSPNFHVTAGAFQTTFTNTTCGLTLCEHGFLVELNADGSHRVYASFLGGTYADRVLGVAVNASGAASVVGYTNSSDFPVTPGAFSTTFHGGACGAFTCSEAFVATFDPTGARLVYATFLGGSKVDEGHEIAIDAGGNAYVTGETNSTDFPVTPGAYETTSRGAGESHAFVTVLNPSGTALVWSTFLGGSNGDHGQGIAFDASGDAVITGWTNSSDFPTTPGAFDTNFSGGGARDDVFVSELNPTGDQLLYST